MLMTGATRQDAVMRTSVEERLAVIASLELRRDDESVEGLLDFAVSPAVEDAVRAVAQYARDHWGALDERQPGQPCPALGVFEVGQRLAPTAPSGSSPAYARSSAASPGSLKTRPPG